MARRFDPVKINIVEHAGWKPYDPGGKLIGYASDSAYDEFVAYRGTEAKNWVTDILGAKVKGSHPRDWDPTKPDLTDEQIEILAKALAERDLEHTSQMVLDALTWSWEEAYTPNDRDIKDALDEADDDVLEETVFYEGDEELWGPILESGWDKEKILKSLLDVAAYEREAGHYDRFVNFEFSDAEAVRALTPSLLADRGTALNKIVRLNAWLKDFVDDFMGKFFKRLDKGMERVDASNRTEFRSKWKARLQDKGEVKAARKEMLEYLKELGDLEESQARLIARSILALADADGNLDVRAAAEIHGDEHSEHHHAQTAEEAARLLGFSRGQIERYIGGRRRGS